MKLFYLAKNKHLLNSINFVLALIIVLLLLFPLTGISQGTICCEREFTFMPIKMPPEQEYDYSGFFISAFAGGLNKLGPGKCPLRYSHLSPEGRQWLEKYNEVISELSGNPPDPELQEQLKDFLDVDYIWKGTLTLENIDYIQPGYWEEGYMGQPDYKGGVAYGDWTFTMELLNSHFGEQVKQGTVYWSGGPRDGIPVIEQLARSQFEPLGDLVWDYERVPFSAEVEPAQDPITAGERMTIQVSDLKDDQGRPTKPWQRIAVKVEHGEIFNGDYNDEGDFYVFEVGNGVQIQYQAPEICETKREKIEVFNSCVWGQEWIRPLYNSDPEQKIGETQFDITPLRDWIAKITYQSIIDEYNPETSAERQVMVTINARLKPRRKFQPADDRSPALKMVDEMRKKMESGTYDEFMNPSKQAELEKALQELQNLAIDVGGMHNYASFGSTVTITDVFDRTDTHEWGTEKWHWSVQYSAYMPLNIGLRTNESEAKFSVSIGTRNPNGSDQPDVPVSYQYSASEKHNWPDEEGFKCSGSNPVNLAAGHLLFFTEVPDSKMVFTGKENVLSGMHSWTEIGGKLNPASEVFHPDPECHGRLWGATIAPLNLDSEEFLSWKFERICK
jgi:hypothetical protein